MAAALKGLSITDQSELDPTIEVPEKEKPTGLSFQILVALTELWYRENCQSSIYMAQTLDEIGVEKYLPGAAEVFSGTLSLLRTSLPPCSKRPCTPTAVVTSHISNLMTMFLALEQSNRSYLSKAVITCGWPAPTNFRLVRRIQLLARAFDYANLQVSLGQPQWSLLENFQRQYYRLTDTIH